MRQLVELLMLYIHAPGFEPATQWSDSLRQHQHRRFCLLCSFLLLPGESCYMFERLHTHVQEEGMKNHLSCMCQKLHSNQITRSFIQQATTFIRQTHVKHSILEMYIATKHLILLLTDNKNMYKFTVKRHKLLGNCPISRNCEAHCYVMHD